MSPSNRDTAVQPPNSWRMVRALGGIGILCSILIVLTFQWTLPIITRKKAEALERAIFDVLPGATSRRSFQVKDNGQLEPFEGQAKGQRLLYAGYDEENRLVGIAMEAEGQGFQDTIRLIYGYSPEKQRIIGLEVLESKETPGLGDRILHDEEFLSNFEALDVSLTEQGTRVKNPVETVKHGKKEHPWQIDGITGATISSKAVGAIIRASTESMLPSLVQQIDKVKRSHDE